jgi:RES domain-containing protein
MKVWRICRERHVETAFSGEGARLGSGRWNSLGTPMAYVSTSLSLAVVEVFVHLTKDQEPDDLVAITAEVPMDEALIEEEKLLMQQRLPSNWRLTHNRELQLLGDEWIRLRQSLAMMVPSAVIDGEWNVVLNPVHPDAAKIEVLSVKPFRFDSRMFKR